MLKKNNINIVFISIFLIIFIFVLWNVARKILNYQGKLFIYINIKVL
jgi:hypothetical protein